MLAEIGELVLDELGSRGRDEHLPPVACGGDACRAVDVATDVALFGQQRRPGVQADADLI